MFQVWTARPEHRGFDRLEMHGTYATLAQARTVASSVRSQYVWRFCTTFIRSTSAPLGEWVERTTS